MRYGFVIDQTSCIGCHACTVACKTEHEVPLGVNRTWVKYIEKGAWPDTKRFFSVMRCNHCTDAPCVEICPTSALFKRDDGIVDFDTDRCIGCKLCSWACPYGAREYDYDHGVMKKCTLCVDRIYNDNLPEEDRVPACVRACPTGARAFGDLGDPDSEVSQSVADRDGFNLLDEFGYKPVNKYLPPRINSVQAAPPAEEPAAPDGSKLEKLFAWADKALSR